MTDVIRDATPDDAEAIRAIYAPFVESTAVSFEIETPPIDVYEAAIAESVYPWLVLERDGEVVGYAKGGRFRDRAAYDWSVEVAVYIAESARGMGVGTRLMNALLDLLREQGYATALAGVTLPNPGSVALFESLGFTKVGVFENVGYKLGAWHGVGWWQRAIGDYPGEPKRVPASDAADS